MVLHCLPRFLVDLAVTLQIWLMRVVQSLAEAARPFAVSVLACQLVHVAEVACDGNDNAALCAVLSTNTHLSDRRGVSEMGGLGLYKIRSV